MANGEMRRCKQRPFWLITLTNDCMRRPSAPPLPESVSAACSAGSATASRWWHFAAPAVAPFAFPSLSPCVGSGGAGFWRFRLFSVSCRALLPAALVLGVVSVHSAVAKVGFLRVFGCAGYQYAYFLEATRKKNGNRIPTDFRFSTIYSL